MWTSAGVGSGFGHPRCELRQERPLKLLLSCEHSARQLCARGALVTKDASGGSGLCSAGDLSQAA